MSSGSGNEVRGGQAGRPAEQRLLIDSIIRRAAEATPEAPAACVGTRENGYSTLSYAELERDANRLAAVLRDRLGISLGDRVLGWADTSIEVLPLFVALAEIGAVAARKRPRADALVEPVAQAGANGGANLLWQEGMTRRTGPGG